jgi:large-conductance mechanosensitive channel
MAVVMGAAFGAVVTALAKDLITPIIVCGPQILNAALTLPLDERLAARDAVLM